MPHGRARPAPAIRVRCRRAVGGSATNPEVSRRCRRCSRSVSFDFVYDRNCPNGDIHDLADEIIRNLAATIVTFALQVGDEIVPVTPVVGRPSPLRPPVGSSAKRKRVLEFRIKAQATVFLLICHISIGHRRRYAKTPVGHSLAVGLQANGCATLRIGMSSAILNPRRTIKPQPIAPSWLPSELASDLDVACEVGKLLRSLLLNTSTKMLQKPFADAIPYSRP